MYTNMGGSTTGDQHLLKKIFERTTDYPFMFRPAQKRGGCGASKVDKSIFYNVLRERRNESKVTSQNHQVIFLNLNRHTLSFVNNHSF